MQQQPSTMNIPTPRIHSLSLQFPLRTKIFIFKAEACLSVEFPLFSSIFQLFHMYSIFSCIFWVGLYMLMMVKTTTVCSTTEGHTPQTRYLAIHRMWENIWLFPYWFPLPPFSSATISVPFFWLFLSSHSSYYFVNNNFVFIWRQDLFLIFANTVYTVCTRFEIEEGDDGVHFPTCLLFFRVTCAQF